MFIRKNMPVDQPLQEAIDAVLAHMSDMDPDAEDYAKSVDQLVKLYKIKDDQRPDRISADVLATVCGHLAGIVLIVGHERAHVVTSKALGFVQKLR